VQIALDSAPGGIGGGHDPRPGRGERGLGLGVGDGGRDQLGEAGQTGVLTGRRRRAVDSTILADAVATQDTA
jgi:hypothetical protein